MQFGSSKNIKENEYSYLIRNNNIYEIIYDMQMQKKNPNANFRHEMIAFQNMLTFQ